jgi:hypothetical protein
MCAAPSNSSVPYRLPRTQKLLQDNLFVSVLAEDIHAAAPDFRRLVNPLCLKA